MVYILIFWFIGQSRGCSTNKQFPHFSQRSKGARNPLSNMLSETHACIHKVRQNKLTKLQWAKQTEEDPSWVVYPVPGNCVPREAPATSIHGSATQSSLSHALYRTPVLKVQQLSIFWPWRTVTFWLPALRWKKNDLSQKINPQVQETVLWGRHPGGLISTRCSTSTFRQDVWHRPRRHWPQHH